MVIYISAAVALAQLDLEVAATKGESIRETTKRNLLTQLNVYEKFCNRYLLSYFPCDNTQLCRFGQHLVKTFQSPDAIGNYLSGVRTILALIGLEVPDIKDKQMQMFTTGLKRTMQHAVKQAAPITPQILLRMSRVVNYRDGIETIAWTATLLGFYMFLRKSNLVPDTMDKFDTLHQFSRENVNLLGLEQAMMFEITWSKTIQFRQKILRVPVLPADNKAICPVYWVYRMLAENPGEASDPLFLINTPLGKLCLSANQLILRLRKWLKLIGEEESSYTLHSLRRGGATFAYQSNMEGHMIKLLGDWASDCYKRYIDISIDQRFDSMKTFVEALNKFTAE